MKTRHLVLLVAVGIAAWLAIFGDKTPDGGASAPADHAPMTTAHPEHSEQPASLRVDTGESRADKSASGSPDKRKPKADISILALRNRAELIGGASSGNGANLFASQSWTPPPAPVVVAPPPPPAAPALPFTYLGKKHEDTAWEVYLAHGDTTLIVHDQSTIEGAYRVDSIKPPVLTLTYLPLNQSQTLQIGDAD